MWREMGITNSYTMEATFCGSLLGKMSRYQFRSTDLEKMGYYLCDTLLDYCDPDQTKVCKISQGRRGEVLKEPSCFPGMWYYDVYCKSIGQTHSQAVRG